MRLAVSVLRGPTPSCWPSGLRIRGATLLPSPTPPRSTSSANPSLSTLQRIRRIATEAPSRPKSRQRWQKQNQDSRWRKPPPPRGSKPILMTAHGVAALGTAAFVQLSEEEDNGSGQTGEMRMLEVSRAEIAKELDDDDRGFTRLRHKVVLFFDLYLWEPLCTGVRFLHLAAIFVPVLLAVPMIWFGKRQKDRDDERTGTLLWYRFLVKGMEWAGPAFIKVRVFSLNNGYMRQAVSSWSGASRENGPLAPSKSGGPYSRPAAMWSTQ